MKWFALLFLALAPSAFAQSSPVGADRDPFASLSFLLGTWEAKTINTPDVTAIGIYTFQMELKNHLVARHSTSAGGCQGPTGFDCAHGDLLYIYSDNPTGLLRAIYFDNEGHTIHYVVTAPTPTTAEFLSDTTQPGPQFRLFYELKAGIMNGRFQIRMPGQQEWKSYLEWTGARKQ